MARHVAAAQFVDHAPIALRQRLVAAARARPAPDVIQPQPIEEGHDEDGGILFGPTDVPHVDQQKGNLFAGSGNTQWYLPTFVLADDPDPAFGFAASQTTQVDQSTGDP